MSCTDLQRGLQKKQVTGFQRYRSWYQGGFPQDNTRHALHRGQPPLISHLVWNMDARGISSLIFRTKIILTDTFAHVLNQPTGWCYLENLSCYNWNTQLQNLLIKYKNINEPTVWLKGHMQQQWQINVLGQTRFAVCKIKHILFLPVWLGSYFKHLESLSSYCFYFDCFNSIFLLFSVGIYFCCCSKMCFPFTYITKSNRI